MKKIDLKMALAERGLKLAVLASAMGVDKGTVTRWGKGRIPAERVIEVERVTGIRREHLRPDLYAAKPANAPSKASAGVSVNPNFKDPAEASA